MDFSEAMVAAADGATVRSKDWNVRSVLRREGDRLVIVIGGDSRPYVPVPLSMDSRAEWEKVVPERVTLYAADRDRTGSERGGHHKPKRVFSVRLGSTSIDGILVTTEEEALLYVLRSIALDGVDLPTQSAPWEVLNGREILWTIDDAGFAVRFMLDNGLQISRVSAAKTDVSQRHSCTACGNPDCPNVSQTPYWRVCPAIYRLNDAMRAHIGISNNDECDATRAGTCGYEARLWI